MANNWTDDENDLIVQDYFSMLSDELAGRKYVKAQHRRKLVTKIARSESAVEFKHQNISAVLKALGETWITGYLPLFNFQMPLVDAVARWLQAHPEFSRRQHPASVTRLQDAPALWIGPPPTLSNQRPPDELEQTILVARKYDVGRRDEQNRALGLAGEKCVLENEKATLIRSGRHDLSEKVRWTSQEDGDGAGYDIESFCAEGKPRLLEVKTTNGWDRTPFFISANELNVSKERSKEWVLFRLYDFSRKPQAFELIPPLDAHVSLMATEYRASFT